MSIHVLPSGKSMQALDFSHFPTRLQAVIWRNWGLVPVEKMAQVLMATPRQIEELALGMGLHQDDSLCPLWHERGYLTIIRRNWHLLPYEQLLELLDFTPDELAYILKEDDFLWHKLGNMKPETAMVCYAPLTRDEVRQTEALKKTISKYFSENQSDSDSPFEFLKRYGSHANKESASDAVPASA